MTTIRLGTNVDRKKIDAVGGLAINQESHARENEGIDIEEDDSAFEGRYVERLFEIENRICNLTRITKIIICVDPSAGGENDTAAVCLAIIDGLLVILWVDYIPRNKGPEFLAFVKTTIWKCSHHFRKGNYAIPIAVAIEANGRLDGDFVETSILTDNDKEFTNVLIIGEPSRGSETKGVNLLGKRKSEFILHFSLNLDANRIRLFEGVGTSNPKRMKTVLETLKMQLLKFRRSDKSAKKGKFNDDAALALLMAVFWIYHFYSHMDYALQRVKLTFVE